MVIKAIYDDDYGCEERDENAPVMVIVVLEDENGIRREVRAEDEWLRLNSLDEGSVWPE